MALSLVAVTRFGRRLGGRSLAPIPTLVPRLISTMEMTRPAADARNDASASPRGAGSSDTRIARLQISAFLAINDKGGENVGPIRSCIDANPVGPLLNFLADGVTVDDDAAVV